MYIVSATKSWQHDRATHRVGERIFFSNFNKCDKLLKTYQPSKS
jgi:hypothetical protein